MSIDASALTSIHNAIASFSSSNSQSSGSNNYIQSLTEASASVSSETRYKKAFEEKLKKATGSDDVEISNDAINALKQFNQNGAQDTEKTDKKSSSDVSYTYDYVTLKKQREQNLAKIEKEVADKYNTASTSLEEDSTEVENSPVGVSTDNSVASAQSRTEVQSQTEDESPTDPHGRPQNNSVNEETNQSQHDSTVSGADEMSESASLSNV